MRSFKVVVFYLSLVIAANVGVGSSATAQSPQPILTEKSSLRDILAFLDALSFKYAHIGLERNIDTDDPLPTDISAYSEAAIFSPGFKLIRNDACSITLRNDDIKLDSFWTKYPDPRTGSLDKYRKIMNDRKLFAAELTIPLNLLKAKKAPYRHTKNVAKARLIGTWRSEFAETAGPLGSRVPGKYKQSVPLGINITSLGPDSVDEEMYGFSITFTFDDKETSEKFYPVFLRAIQMCREH